MIDIFYWQWFILTFILLIFEVFIPGTFLLWVGMATGSVGILTWLFPLPLAVQLLLFGGATLFFVYLWNRFFRKKVERTDESSLNNRGAGYVGKTYTLEEPIKDGKGRISIDDTLWRIKGEDLPKGAKVRILKVDGVVLIVDPVKETPKPLKKPVKKAIKKPLKKQK